MATSVTKDAISWTFDADYTVGQYNGGDYYVVAPSNLKIIAITGADNASAVVAVGSDTRVKNGSIVNPNGTTSTSQGLDSYFAQESYPLNAYNPSLNVARPVVASAADLVIDGVSNLIVSSASHSFVAGDVGCAIRISAGTGFTRGMYKVVSVAGGKATLARACGTVGSTGGTYRLDSELSSTNYLELPPGSSLMSFLSTNSETVRPSMKDCSILTVVATAPAANSFRPGYCGTDKTMNYTTANLNYGVLQSLVPTASTPAISVSENRMDRPWIEYLTSDDGRDTHPTNNMPDYGREIMKYIGEAVLQLHLNYSNATKQTLMIYMVQMGIDIYSSAKSGGVWADNGGHGNGRKLPLLLAALTFNDSAMLAYCDKSTHNIFSDDRQFFVVSAADQARSVITGDATFPRSNYARVSSTVTISNGSPAVVTYPSPHTLIKAQWVKFTTTGTLPSPLVPGVDYYIPSTGLGSLVHCLKATFDGAVINTTTAGSGVHTATFDPIDLPEWGEKHTSTPSRDGSNCDAKYRDVVTENIIANILAAQLLVGGQAAWGSDTTFDYVARFFAIYNSSHFDAWHYEMYLAYGGGESPVSVPSAPSLCVATATRPGEANIAWQDNSSDETSFTVERANSSGGTYQIVGTVGAGVTSYVDTSVLPARTYWYKIRAWNLIGPSTYSNNDDVLTLIPTPSASNSLSNAAPGFL